MNIVRRSKLIDYTNDSTVVGFSALTTKKIHYELNCDLLFVYFIFIGTSNSANCSFTVPFANDFSFPHGNAIGLVQNNGSYSTTPGYAKIFSGQNIVNLYRDANETAWTASGAKSIRGQFSFKIAI